MKEIKPDAYTLSLTTLVYGGEALGRLPDGRAVFVPFGLPGERVRLRLVEEKPRYARGEIVELIEPSPDRIPPRCAHFGVCGGCHYQHLPYAAQLEAKRAILIDQLERIGGFVDPPVAPVVPSPQPYYYRNHVQFALTQHGALGYHRQRSDEVFAVRECHLPEAPLNAVWPQLTFEAGSGVQRVGLRLGLDEEVMLALESETPESPDLSVEELDLSVTHLSPAGTLVLAGSDHLFIEVLGRPFRVSAGSFFQVNTPLAEALVRHVLAWFETFAQQQPGMTVLDVYCGVGLFSAFLAPQAARLLAVEASPDAAGDFAANLDEFEHVELYEAPAELALPHLNLQPDFALVDPPRAGLEPAARAGLLKLAPPRLAYVSCDPATLARDGRRLGEAGYRLVQVTPFDLFPQTYHIESVSFWEK